MTGSKEWRIRHKEKQIIKISPKGPYKLPGSTRKEMAWKAWEDAICWLEGKRWVGRVFCSWLCENNQLSQCMEARRACCVGLKKEHGHRHRGCDKQLHFQRVGSYQQESRGGKSSKQNENRQNRGPQCWEAASVKQSKYDRVQEEGRVQTGMRVWSFCVNYFSTAVL